MPEPFISTHDFSLHHSNRWEHYRIARDENGVLIWQPGVAPDMTPQVRQEQFDYTHVPPEISVITGFEDWRGGAGFVNSRNSRTNVCDCYSHSRGVDASWKDRLYLGPARQQLEGLDAVPTHITHTSQGVFAVAGRYLYQLVAGAWLERHDLGAGEAFTGPVVEFNSYLVAPAGDAAAYVYATNPAVWTASTLTGDEKNAYLFTVRGEASNDPQLWKTNSTGAVSVTASPENGGPGWSQETQLGHTGETVSSFITAADKLWLFKIEGFYSFDGQTPEDVFKSAVLDVNNGHAFLWVDGLIYAWYGRLMQFSPETHEYDFAFPSAHQYGHPEVNGVPYQITGDGDWLYMTLGNSNGDTYLMKGRGREGWHTLAYLPGEPAGAVCYAPSGSAHASNPVLYVHGDFYIMARPGLRPEDDANYRYVDAGSIFGAYQDIGARGFPKFLNQVGVYGKNLAIGRDVIWFREIDDAGEFLEELEANRNGLVEQVVADDVEYNQLRYRVDMRTNDAERTPVVKSMYISSTLNNPRKRLWQVGLVVGPNEQMSGGGQSLDSALNLEEHLFTGLRKRVTARTRTGNREYRVRILDIQNMGTQAVRQEDRNALMVTLAEI